MPVRKIPKNHLVVTGVHASRKSGSVEFESPLEQDHMLLLDFDDRVAHVEAQPVRIPFGERRFYTPDLLVTYKRDPCDIPLLPTELVEVKASADLIENKALYVPKFEAAMRYAEERDWRFVVKTELDIRVPRLATIKFLRGYMRHTPIPAYKQQFIDLLTAAGGCSTTETLLDAVSKHATRAECVPTLWAMVCAHELLIDLDEGTTSDVSIWLPRS